MHGADVMLKLTLYFLSVTVSNEDIDMAIFFCL